MGEDLLHLYIRTREAANSLHTQATEILEMAKDLERLTKDTPSGYAGMRARVEARAALEQAEELRRVLKKLLGEEPSEEDA
jgi:DNA mismatch repair ATPase MutS